MKWETSTSTTCIPPPSSLSPPPFPFLPPSPFLFFDLVSYADVCLSTTHPGRQLLKHLAASDNKLSVFAKAQTVGYEVSLFPSLPLSLSLFLSSPSSTPYLLFHVLTLLKQPCVDTYLTNYLNQPAVKDAIHALPTIKWAGCSAVVNYSYV